MGEMQGNQAAMDGFVSVTAGTLSPVAFFAPDNVESIIAAAATMSTSS